MGVGVCVCVCGMLICFVSALGSHEIGRHKLSIIIIIIILLQIEAHALFNLRRRTLYDRAAVQTVDSILHLRVFVAVAARAKQTM